LNPASSEDSRAVPRQKIRPGPDGCVIFAGSGAHRPCVETLASRGAAIRAGPVQNRRNSRSDRPDGLFVRRSDDKFV